jgi:hypothetical protein
MSFENQTPTTEISLAASPILRARMHDEAVDDESIVDESVIGTRLVNARSKRPKTRSVRTVCVGTFLLIVSTLCWVGFRASQRVPDFYHAALAVSEESNDEADEQLRQRLDALAGKMRVDDRWELCLTESEINGWLANRLPLEYPNLMPNGASLPRVAIVDNELCVAVRYQYKSIDTVVSGRAAIVAGQDANVMDIEVLSLSAGMLPLPVERFSETVTRVCKRAGLELNWGTDDESRRAKVLIPARHPHYRFPEIRVDAITIANSEVLVSGRVIRGGLAMRPAWLPGQRESFPGQCKSSRSDRDPFRIANESGSLVQASSDVTGIAVASLMSFVLQ